MYQCRLSFAGTNTNTLCFTVVFWLCAIFGLALWHQTTDTIMSMSAPFLIVQGIWCIRQWAMSKKFFSSGRSLSFFFWSIALFGLWAWHRQSDFLVSTVRKSIDSPAEFCFFLWIVLNIGFFLLYCERCSWLQPQPRSLPEDGCFLEPPRPITSALEIANEIENGPRAAGALTMALSPAQPARAATSPARGGVSR